MAELVEFSFGIEVLTNQLKFSQTFDLYVSGKMQQRLSMFCKQNRMISYEN